MRTVIIGLDAYDPILFEKLYEQGKLPNLGGLLEGKGYSRFQVANPPQSEVSWTSIATGLNPGEHGMFDFVHRDPASYSLQVSLLPTGRNLGGLQFVRPYNARTIFDVAAERGYHSTSLWWPATFPARPESPVRTLPGLGAPDIQGRLGVGSLFCANSDLPEKQGKTPVFQLKKKGSGHYQGEFEGPRVNSKSGPVNAVLPLELIVKDDHHVELQLGHEIHSLTLGKWSPILELRFKISWMASVHAITRIILTQINPSIQLYALPLQIHPIHPIWRYGTPATFVKEAWQTSGPFLTLGWPQDTTALEDGCINDEQFLALCDSIFEARSALFDHLLGQFREGLLASVFDSLDRIQHMFWRNRPDVVEAWYLKYDRLVGKTRRMIESQPQGLARLLVISDHGFNTLDQKVHLNHWLIENGYLFTQAGMEERAFKSIDWSRSRAYAIGLNSLYLNLAGREREGIVLPQQRDGLIQEIQSGLGAWTASNHQPVVHQAYSRDQVFHGNFSALGPDILVGYTPGFRASAETGLGAWGIESLETNHDHWEADHCFDAVGVPGVIFSSSSLSDYPHPSYTDVPAIAINAAPDAHGAAPPPRLEAEDQAKVEERLKSLGYL